MWYAKPIQKFFTLIAAHDRDVVQNLPQNEIDIIIDLPDEQLTLHVVDS